MRPSGTYVPDSRIIHMYACMHTYVLSRSFLLQVMTHARRDTPATAAVAGKLKTAAGKLKTAAGKLKLCVQLQLL